MAGNGKGNTALRKRGTTSRSRTRRRDCREQGGETVGLAALRRVRLWVARGCRACTRQSEKETESSARRDRGAIPRLVNASPSHLA
eukprot:1418058-Pleurochrysis_carterae.AAC.1